jgi:preprotein translocase subunit SecF
MVRIPNIKTKTSAQLSNEVLNTLKTERADVELRKVEFIGPSVGSELVTHGATAILLVCLGIIAYLAIRFEWRFAVSAVIANMHDVVIILGFFALFQWEFSLTVLAGILAVLGYSVNESVVVFDRIRENFRKPNLRGKTVPQVIDNAITATISRTIITHGSTEFMVLSMLLFGGAALHGFAMALTIGIVFGIYSSVLVASPLLLMFGVTRENMVKPVRIKEEAVV